MPKPPLLYVSPFPPQPSGIADFSATLAEALRPYFDLTLLVEDRTRHHLDGFQVLGYRNDRIDWERYPHRFYHIGNNPWYHGYIYEACLRYPGVVLLHDSVLYYLYVGYYRDRPDFYSRVYDGEGAWGIALLKQQLKHQRDLLQFSDPQLLPFHRELIHSANRFLTHSNYARNQVLAHAERPLDIATIPHIVLPVPLCDEARRRAARERLGIADGTVLLASFGFVAPTKLNHVICAAVNRLNAARAGKLDYVMVGEGSYVDALLNEHVRVTGYVSSAEYDEYLAACDLVLNLRYPSMGETSGAALRALNCGKPCVFTNHGWFAELPDEIAVKLEPDPAEIAEAVLQQTIELFLSHRGAFEDLGRRAAAYTQRYHQASVVAPQIADFILGGS